MTYSDDDENIHHFIGTKLGIEYGISCCLDHLLSWLTFAAVHRENWEEGQ